ARLTAWISDQHPPVSIHRIRVVFLSRMYIATLLELPTEDIIHRQLEVCETQRIKIQANLQSASSPFETLTLQFVMGQLEAAIEWLKHCKEYPLVIPSISITDESPSI
ncbi:MAG: hypothetical protein H0S82_08970, partial [Anaerolineaceae bacterium]|nr:hypothetical protein [Anaerolineaceae bacterium]